MGKILQLVIVAALFGVLQCIPVEKTQARNPPDSKVPIRTLPARLSPAPAGPISKDAPKRTVRDTKDEPASSPAPLQAKVATVSPQLPRYTLLNQQSQGRAASDSSTTGRSSNIKPATSPAVLASQQNTGKTSGLLSAQNRRPARDTQKTPASTPRSSVGKPNKALPHPPHPSVLTAQKPSSRPARDTQQSSSTTESTLGKKLTHGNAPLAPLASVPQARKE